MPSEYIGLCDVSVKKLKAEYNSLCDVIYGTSLDKVACFGVRNIIRREEIATELERRGYELFTDSVWKRKRKVNG